MLNVDVPQRAPLSVQHSTFNIQHSPYPGFLSTPLRVQLPDTEALMRRKPKVIPVRSTLLSVVLILSAVLFVSLALVSCKSESDARRKAAAELPQTPPNQPPPTAELHDAAPPPPSPLPPMSVAYGRAA